MLDNWLDGSGVNLIIAFLGGFITFFASCLLPLVPTYLAYLAGVSLSEQDSTQKKWQIFRTGLFFVLGFIATFILLGLAANQFGALINTYRTAVEKIAGGLFILLGLFMLGVFKSKFLSQEKKFNLHNKFQKNRFLHAFLTGIAFGFGWSPCIGPVLAVILFWAARAESMLKGVLLLTAYGIGLGAPFLIIALGFEKIVPWLKRKAHLSRIFNSLAAILIILVGILLLIGQWQAVSIWLIRLSSLNEFSV